jgi:hypothetical protein
MFVRNVREKCSRKMFVRNVREKCSWEMFVRNVREKCSWKNIFDKISVFRSNRVEYQRCIKYLVFRLSLRNTSTVYSTLFSTLESNRRIMRYRQFRIWFFDSSNDQTSCCMQKRRNVLLHFEFYQFFAFNREKNEVILSCTSFSFIFIRSFKVFASFVVSSSWYKYSSRMFDDSINSKYLLSDSKHASSYKTCCFISFEHSVSN